MLRNPLDPSRPVKAVLFDLDGTLYRQDLMRSLMALELLTLPIGRPLRAAARLRALKAYRHAQEGLRGARTTTQAQTAGMAAATNPGRSHSGSSGSVAEVQVRMAAEAAGLPIEEVGRLVEEWMQRRPLKYLRFCRAAGLTPLLDYLDRARVPVGVLSDYPAAEKLAALGLAGRFSPVVCTTDPGVNALKPDPRGFTHVCEHWGLASAEVLMVGDRVDVDAGGAVAAGMPCVIMSASAASGPGYVTCSSFERLHRVLDARD